MLGLLFSLLVCCGAAAAGSRFLRDRAPQLDDAERRGVGGILGLGTLGLGSFLFALVPGGAHVGPLFLACALLLTGLWLLAKGHRPSFKPTWQASVGLLGLIPLIGALAPSTSLDWDSLAYHLAVPKLWLEAGQVSYIDFIHHSNFPFVADALYLVGLPLGEPAAKAFSLGFFVLGMLALFGLARRRFGSSAGWWTALAFAGAPVALWESGTAYIDISHGLFAGLGVLYASELAASDDRRWAWLSGVCLGLAVGTKYTGLVVVLAIAVPLGAYLMLRKRSISPALIVGLLPLLVASPFLVRNFVNTGNPVYPFFFERFGGRDWDAWRADIYKEEQATFGVSQGDPTGLPHAVLGLGYQPGRYANPGQTEGAGFPGAAVGVVPVLGLLLYLGRGSPNARDGLVLVAVLLIFTGWFALSQQSRYLTAVLVPVAVLAGGFCARPRCGRVLAGVVALQAAYSCAMLWTLVTRDQLPVALGLKDRDVYRTERVLLARHAPAIERSVGDGKVALFDEVFGYLLNTDYAWANPGHSTRIPYDRMDTGDDFADEMRRQGFTHVYVSPAYMDRSALQRWVEACTSRPYSPQEKAEMDADLRNKWKRLVADAAYSGRLELQPDGGMILFAIADR